MLNGLGPSHRIGIFLTEQVNEVFVARIAPGPILAMRLLKVLADELPHQDLLVHAKQGVVLEDNALQWSAKNRYTSQQDEQIVESWLGALDLGQQGNYLQADALSRRG